MPRKRRIPKRGSAAGLQEWWLPFECGKDYFNDLEKLGLDVETDGLAAWRRLGEQFLAQREPDPARLIPWALEVYGSPSGWR